MLKVFCDCCGKDAKLCAYDLRVNLLHNPVPTDHFGSFDEPKVTSDPRRMRFTLCSECYRRLGLPNIYQATEEKTVKFRDKPHAGEWPT